MLVVARLKDQRLIIEGDGWQIDVMVIAVKDSRSQEIPGGRAVLGVDAPEDVLVLRSELAGESEMMVPDKIPSVRMRAARVYRPTRRPLRRTAD
jgi:sRNA-binding carbon storage regulator CsrA